MASVCLTERGGCLFHLGRLDDAAEAYEEGIRHAEKRGDERDAAVGQANVGTVRQKQHRYQEALAAMAQARERFTRMEEPGSVAGLWHQTGRVYQEAGQLEGAEDAYRKALAGWVRLGDSVAQAATLGQLGLLSDALGRPEEAVTLLRQAAEKHLEKSNAAGEGQARSNLAVRLARLGRRGEARQEVGLAIQCQEPFGHASEPWKTWDILADIERDAGNAGAAAAAKQKATACYLAYRHDGGENHNTDGRIGLAVIQHLRSGDRAKAVSVLRQAAADPEGGSLRPFLGALAAVVAGSRDRAAAGGPELDYMMAAEVLFLIETLERADV